MLVAEGFDQHVPKGYIYSAMAFSLFVEMLNLRAGRGRRRPPAPAALVSRSAGDALPRRGTSSLSGALR